jgi:hypothetical protein
VVGFLSAVGLIIMALIITASSVGAMCRQVLKKPRGTAARTSASDASAPAADAIVSCKIAADGSGAAAKCAPESQKKETRESRTTLLNSTELPDSAFQSWDGDGLPEQSSRSKKNRRPRAQVLQEVLQGCDRAAPQDGAHAVDAAAPEDTAVAGACGEVDRLEAHAGPDCIPDHNKADNDAGGTDDENECRPSRWDRRRRHVRLPGGDAQTPGNCESPPEKAKPSRRQVKARVAMMDDDEDALSDRIRHAIGSNRRNKALAVPTDLD